MTVYRGPWREWRGFIDMGIMGWPRPRPVIFEDRITGTLYLLSHDSGGPVLLTPVPRRASGRPEEPILVSPIGRIILFVANGALAYELYNSRFAGDIGATGRADDPVFTLNYSDQRTTYEVHARGLLAYGGALCLRRWDSLGLTTEITDLGCSFLATAGSEVFQPGVFVPGVFVAGE